MTMDAASTPVIDIKGLSKRFGRTLALDSVDLSIKRNELFAILGPNGAGKSTMILTLCGLLKPDAGAVTLDNVDVLRNPLKARKSLGVVFQESSLDTRLTVEENLEFHGRVFQVPARLRKERIDQLLEIVEMTEARSRLVRTLSSGMKRRVEIARALTHDSRVVILDEPTVGLDAQSRARIWEYLGRLRREREITLIVTTHYIEEVENCDRICIIDRGKVLAIDTPEALRSRHGAQTLRIAARDAATATRLRGRFPDAVLTADGDLVIPTHGPELSESLLAEFGAHLKSLSFDRSTLESVYLDITGRAVRDSAESSRVNVEGRQSGQEPRL